MPPEAEPPIQPTPTAHDQELLPTKSPQVVELQLQPAKPSHEMQYRPDIDGLRTLAVVPVVLFHAYPELFPGGFIGVDIFFVISGYLISGILLKEHAADQFSYYNFYSRRIRRIFPILLVVLSTTLWMGCLYFLASKLKALAATMLAGSLFCANLQVLSLEKGYFDDDIKTNPLLHLWSLGVEEQFYIIWPFFVSLVARLTSIRRAVVYQVVFMGLSFVMNVAMLGFHGTNKFSFYFPLCRFWQMSIGGLVAFLHSHDALKQLGTSKLMSISGLICIVIGFILIDELRAFPGYWALFPTCGAALLIAAGPEAPFNYNILSSQVMVYVGKISYALYLWHWPLLVFAKARFPNDAFRPFYMQPYVMILVAVALSINFSGFENRVRRIKSKWVVVILLVIMAGVSVLSLAVYKFPKSFSLTELSFQDVVPPTDIELEVVPEVSEVATNASNFVSTNATFPSIASSTPTLTDRSKLSQPNPSREKFVKQVTFEQAVAGGSDMHDAWSANLTALDEKSPYGYQYHAQILNPNHETTDGLIVVLGDSHADMLKPRFVKLYQKAQKENASFPTMVFKTLYGRPTLTCREDTKKDFDMILRVKPQAVFYSVHWSQYLRPDGKPTDPLHDDPPCCFDNDKICEKQSPRDAEELLRRWKDQVKTLTAAGIRVFVAQLHVESWFFYFWSWMENNQVKHVHEPLSLSAYRKEHAWLFDVIESATREANATLIDFSDNLCWQDKCAVVNGNGEPVYSDNNHFRAFTSRTYLNVLDQIPPAGLIHQV